MREGRIEGKDQKVQTIRGLGGVGCGRGVTVSLPFITTGLLTSGWTARINGKYSTIVYLLVSMQYTVLTEDIWVGGTLNYVLML